MEKKIDLHVHTKASDGTFSPFGIIDYAINRNICSLAICDHDTVAGVPEAMDYAGRIGFDLIPGVEFSLDYQGGSFHLLGLCIDYKNTDLIKITGELKESRIERIKKIVKTLKKDGYDIPLEEVEKEAMGAAVGKPHIARVMIRMGYAEDMACVFKNFMCHGKPGYVKRDRISLDQAISVIKDAGGIPVIAHPVSLNFRSFDEFEEQLNNYIVAGVAGIEAYSSMHSMSDVSEFLRIANKKNILVTGGSDFHGDKGKEIGVYTDGNYIPAGVLDDLRRYKELNLAG